MKKIYLLEVVTLVAAIGFSGFAAGAGPSSSQWAAGVIPESRTVVVLKALIVSSAVLLFLVPLGTPPGIFTGLLGSLLGFVLAQRVAARIRLLGGLALGLITIGLGQLISRWLVEVPLGLDPSVTLFLADAIALGLAMLGGVFCVRVV